MTERTKKQPRNRNLFAEVPEETRLKHVVRLTDDENALIEEIRLNHHVIDLLTEYLSKNDSKSVREYLQFALRKSSELKEKNH